MCYTDLNRAALERAVGDAAHPKRSGRSAPPRPSTVEAIAAGQLAPERPKASRARVLSFRIWVWGLAGILLVVGTVFGNRVYQSVRPLGGRQGDGSQGRSTPAAETTPARVSRAPTYTFTPTSTATRTPRATATPIPTYTPTATPTSTLTPTPRPTPTPIVHTVKAGETLYSIARLYDVDVADLSEANELTVTSFLHPDDQLVIPIPIEGATPAALTAPDEVLHTVQEGERLRDIAQRYGISESLLRRVNGLDGAAAVSAGDKLVVPLINGPAPTTTPAPTATPTPGLPYAAPHLLYPLHNAEFYGRGETVMLQWTSVGILKDGDWYALSLRYIGSRADGQPSEITIYTRVTSWRVPEEWYPGVDAPEQRFEWTVQVVRRPTLADPPMAISPPGDLRKFTWS